MVSKENCESNRTQRYERYVSRGDGGREEEDSLLDGFVLVYACMYVYLCLLEAQLLSWMDCSSPTKGSSQVETIEFTWRRGLTPCTLIGGQNMARTIPRGGGLAWHLHFEENKTEVRRRGEERRGDRTGQDRRKANPRMIVTDNTGWTMTHLVTLKCVQRVGCSWYEFAVPYRTDLDDKRIHQGLCPKNWKDAMR